MIIDFFAVYTLLKNSPAIICMMRKDSFIIDFLFHHPPCTLCMQEKENCIQSATTTKLLRKVGATVLCGSQKWRVGIAATTYIRNRAHLLHTVNIRIPTTRNRAHLSRPNTVQ